VGGRPWRHYGEIAVGRGVAGLFTSEPVFLECLNNECGYGVETWQRRAMGGRGWGFYEEIAGVQGVPSLPFQILSSPVMSYVLNTKICT
jgi:hypothetical protein